MKLSEEARRLQREYKKAWRQKNKKHIKNYNVEYWNKKALEAKIKAEVEAKRNDLSKV